MTISELIAKLETARSECGDVDVWSYSKGADTWEDVTGLSIAGDNIAAVVTST